MKRLLLLGFMAILAMNLHGQIVPVGSGSYTLDFPAPAVEGRREQPRGVGFGTTATPKVTTNLANTPVPTNDWWSTLLWTTHNSGAYGWGFYAYPLSYRYRPDGLGIEYTVPTANNRVYKQPMSEVFPIVVGVEGLASSQSMVGDFSDWTVTPVWQEGGHSFKATIGMGMPFTYYEKSPSEVAKIKLNFGSTTTIQNEVIIIENNFNNASYAVFGPVGSTWTQNGSTFTSNLNGKTYWSVAMLPPGVDVATAVNQYKQYAYVFPANTQADWNYNSQTGSMTTTFSVTPDVKEGTGSQVLQGLLPHQWGNIKGTSPSGYSYPSVRGEIKTMASNSFEVENHFRGILPTLPDLAKYSNGFSTAELYTMVDNEKNTGLSTWTDLYNDGKKMNRLAQLLRIADQIGHTEAKNSLLNTIKARLEDWISAESGETDFVLFYDNNWKAMLGYPAGHGHDWNLNDHHFHWGYIVHMAALVEQYDPGWANQWGEIVNLLIRDAASPNRNDTQFPYLRNFSPFAGHSWANGSGTDPNGNDQESSSESMQFHSALIHWGTITGNDEVRDLGIYLYTTELSAIEEYYWDVNNRTFQPEHGYEAVSRIWGSGYDAETFWTLDIGPMWGINFLPVHGGSLYLGYRPDLVSTLWNDITSNTGILAKEANPNIWYDVYWMYLAFSDPQQAINLYNDFTDYPEEFGESKAHTYHWLHTMNALGHVDASITANYPIASVFNKSGDKTYVAHNYGNAPITVSFSDGFTMQVPANQMVTSKDLAVSVNLTNPVDGAKLPSGANINLEATVTGSGITKVEFYDGDNLLGTDTSSPYSFSLTNLPDYVYNYTARAYVGSVFEVSNRAQVQVGLGIPQTPFLGSPFTIPGDIQAGHFDIGGQNVAYFDASVGDQGGGRPDDWVDVENAGSEGLAVGWIDSGEWLEYTVNVTQAGVYRVDCRVASGLASGGGPFHFELDESPVGTGVSVSSTGAWDAWSTVSFNNVPLSSGQHILRVAIDQGGFNLGRMTFTRTGGFNDTQAPSTPTNLAITNTTSSSLSINWTASTDDIGVTAYDIYNGGAFVQTVTSTTATISGLNSGTSYTLGVVAKDAAGNASAQAQVTGSTTSSSDTEAPTSPSNFIASATTTTSISVTWGASSDNVGVVAYDLYKDGVLESTTTATTYTYTGLTVNTSYLLGVVAKDAAGNASSASNVTAVTDEASNGNCTGNAVSGDYSYELSGDATNPTLTFKPLRAGVGSSLVILYYGTSPTGGYPGYLVSADVPFQINASNGQEICFYYTYNVPEGGEQNSSANRHCETVGNCGGSSSDTQAPSAPSNLTTTGKSETSISIAWTASTDNVGVSSYEVSNGSTLVTSTSSTSATISGLTANTAYTFNVVAKDAAGNTSAAGQITASTDPTSSNQTPFTAHAIPGKIEAEDFDNGGEGIAYADFDGSNNGGQYRLAEGVDVQQCFDTGEGFNVGWSVAGEFLEYTIGTVAAGTYTINFRVASDMTQNQTIRVSLNGVNLGTITPSYSGGWQSWETESLNNVTLVGGSNQVLRLDIDAGGFNLNNIEFVPVGNSGGSCPGGDDNITYTVNDRTINFTRVNPNAATSGNAPSNFMYVCYNTTGSGNAVEFCSPQNINNTLTWDVPVSNGQTVYFYYIYNIDGGQNAIPSTWYSFTAGQCGSVTRVANHQKDLKIQEPIMVAYPNPFTDKVQLTGIEEPLKWVRVYDVAGNQLKVIEQASQSLDLSTLPKGMLILQVQAGEKWYRLKVIKR